MTITLAAINWFEIPCANVARAQAFYEAVLARPMRRENLTGQDEAVFAYAEPATGGSLIAGQPSDQGVRVYLDCAPSLDAAVARVAAAGGQVLQACIELPQDIGFIATLRDTEGNTVGLHCTQR